MIHKVVVAVASLTGSPSSLIMPLLKRYVIIFKIQESSSFEILLAPFLKELRPRSTL